MESHEQGINGYQLRVVVLDDDEDMRFAIGRVLGKCGCTVTTATTVNETLEVLEQGNTDVVFSDMRLPGQAGGEELLAAVTVNYPQVQVVLMSCAMEPASRTALMGKGAFECLQKPFFKDTCMPLVERLQNPLQKTA